MSAFPSSVNVAGKTETSMDEALSIPFAIGRFEATDATLRCLVVAARGNHTDVTADSIDWTALEHDERVTPRSLTWTWHDASKHVAP